MRHLNLIPTVLTCLFSVVSCNCGKSVSSDFYTVKDGQFMHDGSPYYFIGTNVWYASEIALSDPARLCGELDSLKSLGLTNLRVCATEDGIDGMDRLLPELEKRGMTAVLYLNNAWEWSPTGYRSYLEDAGAGHQPLPSIDGYWPYMCAMADFATNEAAVAIFHEHVKKIVSRYADSPAIFSWQICNEPRPFSTDSATVDAFVNYIHATAELIHSLDSNHLVSTGNEGAMGCNDGDYGLCRRLNDCPYIDYMTIHIWPFNWSWVKAAEESSNPAIVEDNTIEYISRHVDIAKELDKPLTIEEFGYPRDGGEWRNDSSTDSRDAYYALVFNEVLKSARVGGVLAGCNFWSWSGFARQRHEFWKEGDDLCGDPSQEAQGLNGVYISDKSTLETVRRYTEELTNIKY